MFEKRYTRWEVTQLVNHYLEDVRSGRLAIEELADVPQPQRDRWCIHLTVGFEKYYMSEQAIQQRAQQQEREQAARRDYGRQHHHDRY